jgi:malonyl-CoA O-methyltransferase
MVDLKENILANKFSAAAGSYDRHSELQRRAAERLLDFIPPGKDYGSVLEIGCGTGIYTKMIAERFSSAEITAVDISPKMVVEARGKFNNREINWRIGDAAQLKLAENFELITGSAAVHWIQPLEKFLKNMTGQLAAGGEMIINLMLEDTLKELHSARRQVAPRKFSPPNLPAESSVRSALEANDLKVLESTREQTLQHYESGRQLLRALNRQGVTAGSSASLTPFSPGELKRLSRLYDKKYKSAQKVYATYDILYLRITRP